MKRALSLFVFLAIQLACSAQNLPFHKQSLQDSTALSLQMRNLALKSIPSAPSSVQQILEFQLIAGKNQQALETLDKELKKDTKEQHIYLNLYRNYILAQSGENFEESFNKLYQNHLKSLDDLEVLRIDDRLISADGTDYFISDFDQYYSSFEGDSISVQEAQNLVHKYFLKTVYEASRKLFTTQIKQDHQRRYVIEDSIVLKMKDQAEVSVMFIRKREDLGKVQPAILTASIYAGTNEAGAMLSASKGYVGVVATTRGKKWAEGPVIPFEYENTDVYQVIDWISKQDWSNGEVAMLGGSYNGFTQWASMKHKVHPALKTIVPMVAIAPGIDYPMENNVLHNYSYSWNFYVTNNKILDAEASGDYMRWNSLKDRWYQSGVAFNKLDSLDGQVNRLWNKYMQHPSYDGFWERMIPYKEEFQKIDIPILTISGYYDDSQRGALYYYNQHLKYNHTAKHYLLLGPYDHWTAQNKAGSSLRNYKLDPSAQIDIRYDLVYQWFDYILKEGPKPSILKDRVNLQVMDTDSWRHEPSLQAMCNDTLKFYLSDSREGEFYKLAKNANSTSLSLEVDFKDRSNMSNTQYYPWPLQRDVIDLEDGLVLSTDPLEEDLLINGSFLGNFELIINKKDIDYSVVLYELSPESKYFHLSYFIGRASYAEDRERRNLLNPGKATRIPFKNTKIISKKLSKGSRLVVVLNVNKNKNAQINYGTGKDVNTENIKDAGEPLELSFTGNSSISIPVWRD